MMPRTLEPELMDDPEQVLAYAQADFSASDEAFVQELLARLSARQLADAPLRIVDLGCGPGNITTRLASRLPKAQLVGIDGAAHMLAHAMERVARDALHGVRLVQATLPLDASPDGQPFDVVLSNSLLHHLHDPGVLWQTTRALLRPGGLVLMGDLRRPERPQDAQALVQRYAQDAPEVLKRDFLASLHAAFSVQEVRAQLRAHGLHELEVWEVGDRHLRVGGWPEQGLNRA